MRRPGVDHFQDSWPHLRETPENVQKGFQSLHGTRHDVRVQFQLTYILHVEPTARE